MTVFKHGQLHCVIQGLRLIKLNYIFILATHLSQTNKEWLENLMCAGD